jgi:hypothetical protein
VLWFERQVVGQLTETADPLRREEVESFVDGTLRAMPEHLRAAIAAASIAIGALARVAPSLTHVRALDGNPIPQIGQYVRLFRSLVLFAEQELPATAIPSS